MNESQNIHIEHAMKHGDCTVVFFSDFTTDMGLKCLLKNAFPSASLLFEHEYIDGRKRYSRGAYANLRSAYNNLPEPETQQHTMPVYEMVNYLLNLKRSHPENKVIVITESHDDIILKLLASLNVFYLLSKRESKHFIYHTVTDSINSFNQHASPEVIKKIGGRWSSHYLTHKQWFILNQLAKKHTPAIVGKISGLHVKTISTHKRNIMKALGFTSLQFLQLLVMLGSVKEVSTMVIKTHSYQYIKLDPVVGHALSEIGS